MPGTPAISHRVKSLLPKISLSPSWLREIVRAPGVGQTSARTLLGVGFGACNGAGAPE